MIILTHFEKLWLNSRGGRNASDVLVDEAGKKYVLMSSGKKGKDVAVYIPEEKEIIRIFNEK
jgi:hypothetical protein